MRPVVVRFQLSIDPAKRHVIGKGSQQLVVACRRLVRPGEDGVDDRERTGYTNSSRRQTIPRSHHAIRSGGVLQRSDDRRADRDDASAGLARPRDRACGPGPDAIGLVEGQPGVEIRVAGRREARRMGERLLCDSMMRVVVPMTVSMRQC